MLICSGQLNESLCFCSPAVSSVCRQKRRLCTTTAGQDCRHPAALTPTSVLTALMSTVQGVCFFSPLNVLLVVEMLTFCGFDSLQDKDRWDQPKKRRRAEGHEYPCPETTDGPHGSQSGSISLRNRTSPLLCTFPQLLYDSFPSQGNVLQGKVTMLELFMYDKSLQKTKHRKSCSMLCGVSLTTENKQSTFYLKWIFYVQIVHNE